MEVIRQSPKLRVHRFDRETVMLGVDSADRCWLFADLAGIDKPISLRWPFRAVQARQGCAASACCRHLRSGRARRSPVDPSASDVVPERVPCHVTRRSGCHPAGLPRPNGRRTTAVPLALHPSHAITARDSTVTNFAPNSPHARQIRCPRFGGAERGRGYDFHDIAGSAKA